MEEVLGKIPTGLIYKDNKTRLVSFANAMALNVFQSNKYDNSADAKDAMRLAQKGQVMKVGEGSCVDYLSDLLDLKIFGC